jgi:hypothetical protein
MSPCPVPPSPPGTIDSKHQRWLLSGRSKGDVGNTTNNTICVSRVASATVSLVAGGGSRLATNAEWGQNRPQDLSMASIYTRQKDPTTASMLLLVIGKWIQGGGLMSC